MQSIRELVLLLKKVKKEKGYSIDDIKKKVDESGEQYPPSRSSIQRIFAEGSEDDPSFKYETLRPVADALLGVKDYAASDEEADIKTFLRIKNELITELKNELSLQNEEMEQALSKEKLKYHEKLTAETDKFQKSLDFAMNQIDLKDKRIDQLLDLTDRLQKTNATLLEQLLTCPCRKAGEILK